MPSYYSRLRRFKVSSEWNYHKSKIITNLPVHVGFQNWYKNVVDGIQNGDGREAFLEAMISVSKSKIETISLKRWVVQFINVSKYTYVSRNASFCPPTPMTFVFGGVEYPVKTQKRTNFLSRLHTLSARTRSMRHWNSYRTSPNMNQYSGCFSDERPWWFWVVLGLAPVTFKTTKESQWWLTLN